MTDRVAPPGQADGLPASVRRAGVRAARRFAPALFGVRLWRRYLRDTGWTRSVRSGTPEDRHGEPIPWLTYAAIDLLGRRVPPHARVLEFGAGQSTLWWARRVEHVTSVEHDAGWFTRLRGRVPGNVRLLHRPGGGDHYATAGEGSEFHVIVIDGIDRSACSRAATLSLGDGGVIVWDNADFADAEPGISELVALGFRRLDLVGPGPLNTYGWTTAILYRDGNCLSL